jgi:hypothetical protein
MALGSTQPQQKWVSGIFPGGKGGRCLGLTTLPCLEIWKPQSPETIWACPGIASPLPLPYCYKLNQLDRKLKSSVTVFERSFVCWAVVTETPAEQSGWFLNSLPSHVIHLGFVSKLVSYNDFCNRRFSCSSFSPMCSFHQNWYNPTRCMHLVVYHHSSLHSTPVHRFYHTYIPRLGLLPYWRWSNSEGI